MEATDGALVTAARGGDGVAYGELFTRYQSRIYNYAYGIAGNAEDAGDIAQEAFVRVFEALPRISGDINFSAYLYRTAHNLAVDTVKGRGRFVAPDALDIQFDSGLRSDPEKVALLQEQQEQAWQAAFELSDNHRAILTLRELHDLSYQDIADILEMPRNTVGVLLARARLHFKEAFRMSSVDIDKLTKECKSILPLLSPYLDGELGEKQRIRVEAHLEQCAFCRLALEEMTECSKSYRAVLPLLPPAALGEGVWTRLGDLFNPAIAQSGTAGSHLGGQMDIGAPAGPTGPAGSQADAADTCGQWAQADAGGQADIGALPGWDPTQPGAENPEEGAAGADGGLGGAEGAAGTGGGAAGLPAAKTVARLSRNKILALCGGALGVILVGVLVSGTALGWFAPSAALVSSSTTSVTSRALVTPATPSTLPVTTRTAEPSTSSTAPSTSTTELTTTATTVRRVTPGTTAPPEPSGSTSSEVTSTSPSSSDTKPDVTRPTRTTGTTGKPEPTGTTQEPRRTIPTWTPSTFTTLTRMTLPQTTVQTPTSASYPLR